MKWIPFFSIVLCLYLEVNAQSSYDRTYLVVVLKQNDQGVVVNANVNTIGGSIEFFKYDYSGDPSGKRLSFSNVEDVLTYVDLHGYNLINSLLLSTEETGLEGQLSKWLSVQYVFKKTGKGYTPLKI